MQYVLKYSGTRLLSESQSRGMNMSSHRYHLAMELSRSYPRDGKHMESLIFAKLGYACTVIHPLSLYQQKLLQRLQSLCVVFPLRKRNLLRYCEIELVIR